MMKSCAYFVGKLDTGLTDEKQTLLARANEAMQRHWLRRNYVNQTNPPPLRPLRKSQELENKPVKAFRSPSDSTR